MYKQRLAPPYYVNSLGVTKTAFPLRGYAGVYMIYKNNKLRYVGASLSDVYKALYRHFQDWSSSKQTRVVYDAKNIKVNSLLDIRCNRKGK